MVSVALRATATVGSSTIRRNEYDVDKDVGGEDDSAQGATRMMATLRMTTSRMASRLIDDGVKGEKSEILPT
jgi:hypothetical protein